MKPLEPHVRAVRAASAALRARPRTCHLPDAFRDAIRDLVSAAAVHERQCRAAPSYPEDADTLDDMLAPIDVEVKETPQACEIGCNADCVLSAPELHGVSADWTPS